jgi:hypothetical protein
VSAECPNCRRPIPGIRLFFKSLWSRWRCEGCGSLLGVDVRRRWLATIPWAVVLFLLLGVLRVTNLGYAIAVPMIIAVGMLNYFLFDRAVVHERAGFRCRQCGYDLQGQVESRCPECGSEFDSSELAAYVARGPQVLSGVPRQRFELVFMVIASAVTLALIGGLLYTRAARLPAIGARPPAPPVTIPADTAEQSIPPAAPGPR